MPTDIQDVTTDVTLATEVNDSLPSAYPDAGAAGSGAARQEEDRTVFADPVEQAILVDRTRLPRRPAGSRPAPLPPLPPGDPLGGDTTIVTADLPSDETSVEVRGAGAGRAPSDGPADADGLFGHYRVVAPLARGGATPLLLAEHVAMGYQVAIKMLPPALVGSLDAEARFFAEAAVAARIAHPSIPMVVDVGHDQRGIAYMAFEQLEGRSVAAHLASGGTFSLEQVVEIGAQVAGALAAAHACGVQHGELRPASVHLCPEPGQPGGIRIKVLDFGVADPHAGEPGWFRAPEQAPGTADQRGDVFALGCVLYQLLAGRPPFDGSAEEVARALAAHDPPPPRVFRADIPWPLDSLVHRMVARRPQDRPASAAQVERELRAFLSGPPALVEQGPLPARAARWARGATARVRRAAGQGWQAVRPPLAAAWRRAVELARRAATQHPRWTVAVITAVLFAIAAAIFLLAR
jgi:hypothetical protein